MGFKSFFCCTLLFAFCCNANAAYVSGQKYISWVEASERLTAGRASGNDSYESYQAIPYVLGVVDSHDGNYFCIPEGVRAGQLLAVSSKYVRARPEVWNVSAAVLISAAFADVFPCQKK